VGQLEVRMRARERQLLRAHDPAGETDEDLGTAVWIDQLVIPPNVCDGSGVYYYYSDICEEFEGGTLEDVRMYVRPRLRAGHAFRPRRDDGHRD
jgi:hypothetical protein